MLCNCALFPSERRGGLCARLQIGQSGFELWPRTSCCVLGQDTLPLSTQVYKCVPLNLMLGVIVQWTSIPSRGGVEILLVTSCYRNRDKPRPDGPLGSYADFLLFSLQTRSQGLSSCRLGTRFLFFYGRVNETCL